MVFSRFFPEKASTFFFCLAMAADEEDVSMPNQNPAGEAIYDARALGVP